MQAVILCAGKGTRMGELTQDIPKPLLQIKDRNLLEYKLEALPENIEGVVLIIGYMGEKIREHFGNIYKNIPITYIEDTTISGTAHALWHAKDILKNRFLVMGCDDIYIRKAMEDCTKYDFSISCIKASREETGSRILLDNDAKLIDFVTHKKYLELREDGGLIFTGLYSLTPAIFNYEPVKLETKEEWGLPQTLLTLAKDYPVKIIETDFWLSISNPEDLDKAREILK